MFQCASTALNKTIPSSVGWGFVILVYRIWSRAQANKAKDTNRAATVIAPIEYLMDSNMDRGVDCWGVGPAI